jgi:hypothetical protein
MHRAILSRFRILKDFQHLFSILNFELTEEFFTVQNDSLFFFEEEVYAHSMPGEDVIKQGCFFQKQEGIWTD